MARPAWWEPKKPGRVKRREQKLKRRREIGDIERRYEGKRPKEDT